MDELARMIRTGMNGKRPDMLLLACNILATSSIALLFIGSLYPIAALSMLPILIATYLVHPGSAVHPGAQIRLMTLANLVVLLAEIALFTVFS